MSKIYRPSLHPISYTLNFPEGLVTQYPIKRYPETQNKTLKAWSTADEYLVSFIKDNQLQTKTTFIYNDSFGYLTTHLASTKVSCVINLKSQEFAISQNLTQNKVEFEQHHFINPLTIKPIHIEVGLIKIPKSLHLFELYLNHVRQHIDQNSIVVCSFMTRHFTKQYLQIAQKYFNGIEQSKAWKKSRLMILKDAKNIPPISLKRNISSKFGVMQQYYGVFSANNIDYASQFLIEYIELPPNTKSVLDLASGNGILAKAVQQLLPSAHIHLVDDSYLAVESSKLNLQGENIHFHQQFNLKEFNDDTFDYVISNPPFHIEHEIDLSLPLNLFKQVKRCLTQRGTFQLVANRHLNYKPHLQNIFSAVEITTQNEKFIVYTCQN